MTVFVGLDQHRAQITAEWLDTATGEIARTRITPGDREGVRRFLSRFAGCELEVALEATTGWRFVTEELRAVGAPGSPRRTGGDQRPARQQAARQDRLGRRAAPARAPRTSLERLMIGCFGGSWALPPSHRDALLLAGVAKDPETAVAVAHEQ